MARRTVEAIIQLPGNGAPDWVRSFMTEAMRFWGSQRSVVIQVMAPERRYRFWRIIASPAKRELQGGKEDGQQSWGAFIYNLGKVFRLFDRRPHFIVESEPGISTFTVAIFIGRYQDHKLHFVVLGSPHTDQPVTETEFATGARQGVVEVKPPKK